MFITTLLLLSGCILNGISANIIHTKAESRLLNPYIPLPDLIHDYFPKIYVLIPDYFLLFCICLSMLYYNTLLNVEKNLLCLGICTNIRPFSVFFTLMPTCMPKPVKTSNIYTNLFLSTHDLMFSGHSLFFISMGNMMDNIFIKVFGPFLLIISRQHYTIDVCVSGLVYHFVYTNLT